MIRPECIRLYGGNTVCIISYHGLVQIGRVTVNIVYGSFSSNYRGLRENMFKVYVQLNLSLQQCHYYLHLLFMVSHI